MIRSYNNTILISGPLTAEEFHRLLAATHNLINKRGYQSINLDFSNCTAAFPGPMMAICAQTSKLQSEKISIKLIPPKKDHLCRLFKNANWAHIIDPSNFKKSVFRGLKQVPKTHF